MKERLANTNDWPTRATITTWSRVTGISTLTFRKYIKAGRLKAERQLNNTVIINRLDLMDCFNIKDASLATGRRK